MDCAICEKRHDPMKSLLYGQFSHLIYGTLMCLGIGTPKNNKFSICSKWKIHYFWVSQKLSKI